jgi:hypothetical protein
MSETKKPFYKKGWFWIVIAVLTVIGFITREDEPADVATEPVIPEEVEEVEDVETPEPEEEVSSEEASEEVEEEESQEADDEESNEEEQSEESEETERSSEEESADDDLEEADQTQSKADKIGEQVNGIVEEDLDSTTITDLRINEDASVDEERYIVLVDLEWDVMNSASTTKDMLDMYSDHLAASLADDELIHEVALFWTVPYHNENDSILKRTYENRDGGMYLDDEAKDINVFD